MERPQFERWSLNSPSTIEDTAGIRRASFVAAMLALVSITLGLSGCGKQAFVVAASEKAQSAPGTFTIPPKVDILMLEDDTGSMSEAYDSVQKQVPQFLDQLQSQGWNYHFAVAPLTTDRVLNQVMASTQDSNWGADWTPAYPGQSASEVGMLSAAIFRKPGDFGAFLSYGDIQNDTYAREPGLANLKNILYNRANGTSFVRSDAMLVVLAMSTGDDTSGINYCKGSDGINRPCNQTTSQAVLYCGSGGISTPCYNNPSDSLSYFKTQISAVKTNASLFKFYAAVTNGESKCQNLPNAVTRSGTRYYAMTQQFGGQSYNLCQQSITNIFDSLSSNLTSVKVNIVTNYLFIDSEPDPSTIVVTAHRGGSSGTDQTIPQDSTNGWSYVGYQSNIAASQYAVNPPVPLNISSGYAIRLNGSAVLSGNDTASVEFKTAGLKDSAK